MDPTEILAALKERKRFKFQLRWKHKTDHLPERGTWAGHSDTHLSVRRWLDDIVLEMAWEDLEWVKTAEHELWGVEVSTREKSYLTRLGATYDNCELGVCDVVLPEGTITEANYDANEYSDHIATLPTGEKIYYHMDETGYSGWITTIVNKKGKLVMGYYPHDDATLPLY